MMDRQATPKIKFKIGDQVIARESITSTIFRYMASKVISITNSGNPIVQFYEEKVEPDHKESHYVSEYVTFKLKLTSKVATFKYNKINGYRWGEYTISPNDVGPINFKQKYLTEYYYD